MTGFALEYVLWIFIVGSIAAGLIYVFGVEVPLYFTLGAGGLFFYMYSSNPVFTFVVGWVGRLSFVLFFVSLIYYLSNQIFFPGNPFEFRFIPVALIVVSGLSDRIGEFVLNLFR